MSRTSLALVLLSAVIAVVLWAVAMLVENHMRSPERVPPMEIGAGNDRGDEKAGPAAESDAADCQETENRLARVIEDSRDCESDDDCTLFDYGYPMDCMSSVSKARISRLREEYKKYDERCDHRVFFDCPTEPYVRLPVCRNSRCTVELDSVEPPLEPLTGRGGAD